MTGKPATAGLRIGRGRSLLRAGRVDEALRELGRAARLNPEDSRVRFWLGAALLRAGDFKNSTGELDRRLYEVPGDLEALALRAAAAAGCGDGPRARRDAAAVVAGSAPVGVRAGALALLGLLEAKEGNWESAREALGEAISTAPGERWLLVLRSCLSRRGGGESKGRASRALSLARAGRLTQAERSCRKALAEEPSSSALLALVEILLRRGRTREAFAALARERPRLPFSKDADELAARYRLSVLAADPAGAEENGEALLDVSRDFRHIEALSRPFFVGEFDFMRLPPSFLKTLFASFDRRAAERPRSPWPRYLRLALRALSGAAGGASSWDGDMAKLSRFPASRYGWMRGLTGQHRLITRRDYAGAELDFRAAAKASRPADWTALCFLGETLLCRRRARAGLAAFAAARRAAPPASRADALAWEGEMRLWLGRPAEALRILEEAIERGAIYAEGWKGGALVLLGKAQEALAALERAIARTPHDAESRTWKAEALLHLGRPRQALAEADRALARYRRYTGFHLLAVRGLARFALDDAAGPREAAQHIPKVVRDFVRAKEPRSRGRSPEAFARLLKGVLRLSRGVRRGSHETAVWTR